MKHRVLRLFLATTLLPLGCSGGSGPGVGESSDAKSTADGAKPASFATPQAKARASKKKENQNLAPGSATD
jgi:hypothetical protein